MTDRELERVLGDALIGEVIDLACPSLATGRMIDCTCTTVRWWAKLGQASDDVSSDTAGQDRTP